MFNFIFLICSDCYKFRNMCENCMNMGGPHDNMHGFGLFDPVVAMEKAVASAKLTNNNNNNNNNDDSDSDEDAESDADSDGT